MASLVILHPEIGPCKKNHKNNKNGKEENKECTGWKNCENHCIKCSDSCKKCGNCLDCNFNCDYCFNCIGCNPSCDKCGQCANCLKIWSCVKCTSERPDLELNPIRRCQIGCSICDNKMVK